MTTVREILDSKTAGPVTIAPDASVVEALGLMAKYDVGAVLVVEGHSLVGIMSARDYARQVVLRHQSSRLIPVATFMTTRVFCVEPTNTIEQCMILMTNRKIRHLPVLDGDRLIGVLSSGDLVKAQVSEQAFLSDQVERYIAN